MGIFSREKTNHINFLAEPIGKTFYYYNEYILTLEKNEIVFYGSPMKYFILCEYTSKAEEIHTPKKLIEYIHTSSCFVSKLILHKKKINFKGRPSRNT